MSPTPHPENIPRDVTSVINTHLHFDHCGGNRLFPGVPIHVQARELADARSLDDYTIREWVDFDGATYVEHEGEVELLPESACCRRPGTRTDTMWSSSRPARARSSSEATWAPRSASSTAARPRDSVACSRSERLRGSPTRRSRRSRNIARIRHQDPCNEPDRSGLESRRSRSLRAPLDLMLLGLRQVVGDVEPRRLRADEDVLGRPYARRVDQRSHRDVRVRAVPTTERQRSAFAHRASWRFSSPTMSNPSPPSISSSFSARCRRTP